jgi:hypothetical protein
MIRKSVCTEYKSTQDRRTARRGLRIRIAAAFRKFANGVDERTANDRTHNFYRSSGTPWSRCLK